LALFNGDPDAHFVQRTETEIGVPRLSEETIELFCKDKHGEGLCREHVENVLRQPALRNLCRSPLSFHELSRSFQRHIVLIAVRELF